VGKVMFISVPLELSLPHSGTANKWKLEIEIASRPTSGEIGHSTLICDLYPTKFFDCP
jgi:hypothetical protein